MGRAAAMSRTRPKSRLSSNRRSRHSGAVDILVNNAGITRDANVVLMGKSRWDEVLGVNLDGAYHAVRAVVSGMLIRGWGRIINVSSPSARMPLPGQAGYAASKAGLEGFTRGLSRDLAAKGVLVNAVSPGSDRDRASRDDAARRARGSSQDRSRWASRHSRRKWRRWSPSWLPTPRATSPDRSSASMVGCCDRRYRLRPMNAPRSRPSSNRRSSAVFVFRFRRGDRRYDAAVRGRPWTRFDRRARNRARARTFLRRADPGRADRRGGVAVDRHHGRLRHALSRTPSPPDAARTETAGSHRRSMNIRRLCCCSCRRTAAVPGFRTTAAAQPPVEATRRIALEDEPAARRSACWTKQAAAFPVAVRVELREPLTAAPLDARLAAARTAADPAVARDSRARLASGHRALAGVLRATAGAATVHADDSRESSSTVSLRPSPSSPCRSRPRRRARGGRRSTGARRAGDGRSERAERRSTPPISRPTWTCWPSPRPRRRTRSAGCEQVDPIGQDCAAQRRRRAAWRWNRRDGSLTTCLQDLGTDVAMRAWRAADVTAAALRTLSPLSALLTHPVSTLDARASG